LNKDTIALINRQKAEIERLETELKAMRGAANSYKAEVERLSSDRYPLKEDGTMTLLPRTDVTKIKAEAIKEFAERLRQRSYKSSDWSRGGHPMVVECDGIDDVLEEMVGERE
jgi:uncharacterized coiled-coil DUF342 family protein